MPRLFDQSESAKAAAKAASDYFNSLPCEERKKLAPLLDDYRRMGMIEAARAFDSAAGKVNDRISTIGDFHA